MFVEFKLNEEFVDELNMSEQSRKILEDSTIKNPLIVGIPVYPMESEAYIHFYKNYDHKTSTKLVDNIIGTTYESIEDYLVSSGYKDSSAEFFCTIKSCNCVSPRELLLRMELCHADLIDESGKIIDDSQVRLKNNILDTLLNSSSKPNTIFHISIYQIIK